MLNIKKNISFRFWLAKDAERNIKPRKYNTVQIITGVINKGS